jgi:uncharacterized membrane protein YtjA (UPF0391 family)
MVPAPQELSRAAHITQSKGFAGSNTMNLVVTLLIIGLIAAVLGFGGIAGASFAMAKVIFFVILVLFLLSIVFGAVGYRRL